MGAPAIGAVSAAVAPTPRPACTSTADRRRLLRLCLGGAESLLCVAGSGLAVYSFLLRMTRSFLQLRKLRLKLRKLLLQHIDLRAEF